MPHHNIMWSIFNALKVLCALPFQPPATVNLVTVCILLPSLEHRISRNYIVCALFRVTFFPFRNMHLMPCISFPVLIAYFLLVLNNISLSAWIAVYVYIHLLKDTFPDFKYWQL